MGIHLTPLMLGGGTRLFENVGDAEFEIARVVDAPGVTHIKYRVLK